MRDGGAYGCAVPRAYANLNPGLREITMLELEEVMVKSDQFQVVMAV